jgi:polyphosphate kinase 2 (PPK2 family)
VLLIFQAMDAAGKDGAIKHVMSGVNPQGCQVFSFKAPTTEELDHDYMWRCARNLPERGRIGIFNRSYFEEVLVVKGASGDPRGQKMPPQLVGKDRLGPALPGHARVRALPRAQRHRDPQVLPHVSRDEQKKRFLERIEQPEKNWKFSAPTPRSADTGTSTWTPIRP